MDEEGMERKIAAQKGDGEGERSIVVLITGREGGTVGEEKKGEGKTGGGREVPRIVAGESAMERGGAKRVGRRDGSAEVEKDADGVEMTEDAGKMEGGSAVAITETEVSAIGVEDDKEVGVAVAGSKVEGGL
jgi:hypothetical protein